MVKVSLPLGFSVDAAALYDQKSADVKYEYTDAMYVVKTTDVSIQSPSGDVVCQKSSVVAKVKHQSINVPVNLRYAVGLGSMANMFFFAGPQWGINVGDENFKWDERSSYSLRKATFSVNVGAGVTLFKHLQGSVNYNIECNKSGKMDTERTNHKWVKGRNNTWQISLGYWF